MKEYFSRKVIDLGDSFAVTLPFQIIKKLDISKGDLCKFQIEKFDEIKEYRCKACNYIFIDGQDEDIVTCPACGQEMKQ